MKPEDLKAKCARVMLESGPDVLVALTVPAPEDLKPGATTLELGLARDGGPRAKIVGIDTIDGKPMVRVHVKAAVLLGVLR
jgi:hypothetical protein